MHKIDENSQIPKKTLKPKRFQMFALLVIQEGGVEEGSGILLKNTK